MQALLSDELTHENLTSQRHDARRRFARFAWGVLAYNVLVVLWGAFVRASYSGDGCGSHWPLCNGEVIPADPTVKTLIEFSHRVTSAAALLLVVLLVWWARRAFAASDPARRATRWALLLTVTEALIGAGLVVFGLVADDDSIARAASLAVHLVNTFLLLAALTLTAWWATDSVAEDGASTAATSNDFTHASVGGGATAFVFGGALAGMLLLGVSGAVAALGDTLFPATSLAQAWSEEMSGAAHTLVRLRVLHPVIAVIVGANILCAAWIAARDARATRRARLAEDAPPDRDNDESRTLRLARFVVVLLLMQMLAGGINVLLLAPVWMQIVHLLLADLLWIAFVLLTAAVFATRSVRAGTRERARRHAFALEV